VERMGRGEEHKMYGVVGKPKEKKPFGRPKRRWEDNIRMGLKKIGCEGLGWFGSG